VQGNSGREAVQWVTLVNRVTGLNIEQHLEALAGLFVQALRLCQKAGLVKLGNVAIDGTKIKANASTRRSVG